MFCEKCGAKIEPGEMFCGICGARAASVPVRNINTRVPNTRVPNRGIPSAHRPGARAAAGFDPGFILIGLGVLMLISSFLPLVKIDIWGYSLSYNLFNLASLGSELDYSIGWLLVLVLAAVVLAIVSGFLKSKPLLLVSGGISVVNLIIWIIITSRISAEMISELGFKVNIFGAGLYLLMIVLGIHGALAIYTGVKK